MRARYPDHVGSVRGDDVQVGFEVFGSGDPTVLLMPTWTIVHSRFWKMQVPYLSRHFRVVTYDGPGNGGSTRSTEHNHYSIETQTRNGLAVMDETGTDRAVLVSLSKGALWSLWLAAKHPERVIGQVFICPSLPLTPQHQDRAFIPATFTKVLEDPQGWEKYNAHHWLTNYRDFAEFFFSKCFTEPHSTKQREDSVGWAMETDGTVLIADGNAEQIALDRETILDWCHRFTNPVLVIQGDEDQISPYSRGVALAEATGGALVTLEGSGHMPLTRDPVRVNRALRDFIERLPA